MPSKKGLLGGLKPKLPILLYCTRCQTPLASEVNFLQARARLGYLNRDGGIGGARGARAPPIFGGEGRNLS